MQHLTILIIYCAVALDDPNLDGPWGTYML